MDITTALLPTTAADVYIWLREMAEQSSTYQGFADDDHAARNAFLLGMATVKLAEAHATYLRMLQSRVPSYAVRKQMRENTLKVGR